MVSAIDLRSIPDRWIENSDPPWTVDSTFDRYDNKGKLLPNADVYVPAGQSGYNGYDPEDDRGLLLMIRAGTGNKSCASNKFPNPNLSAPSVRKWATPCFAPR